MSADRFPATFDSERENLNEFFSTIRECLRSLRLGTPLNLEGSSIFQLMEQIAPEKQTGRDFDPVYTVKYGDAPLSVCLVRQEGKAPLFENQGVVVLVISERESELIPAERSPNDRDRKIVSRLEVSEAPRFFERPGLGIYALLSALEEAYKDGRLQEWVSKCVNELKYSQSLTGQLQKEYYAALTEEKMNRVRIVPWKRFGASLENRIKSDAADIPFEPSKFRGPEAGIQGTQAEEVKILSDLFLSAMCFAKQGSKAFAQKGWGGWCGLIPGFDVPALKDSLCSFVKAERARLIRGEGAIPGAGFDPEGKIVFSFEYGDSSAFVEMHCDETDVEINMSIRISSYAADLEWPFATINSKREHHGAQNLLLYVLLDIIPKRYKGHPLESWVSDAASMLKSWKPFHEQVERDMKWWFRAAVRDFEDREECAREAAAILGSTPGLADNWSI